MSDKKKGKAKSQNLPRAGRKSAGVRKPSIAKRFKQQKPKGFMLGAFTHKMARPTTGRLGNSSARIHGTDFFQSVNVGATALAAGDVVISQAMSPALMPVTRLALLSRLYEKYKFARVSFRYAPIANAQITGQLLGYFDMDTQDDPTGSTGYQNIQRAAAHTSEEPTQVFQPVKWEMHGDPKMTVLYTDASFSDPRWTNQGRFVLLAASTIAANQPLGNIYVDYDIEFSAPQLESTPTGGFGFKVTGGGSMSASAFLGTAPVYASWNNVPITYASNVFSLPAGAYIIAVHRVGTTLGSNILTHTGTTVYLNATVNSGATENDTVAQLTSSSPFTVTLTGTAAAVSACTVCIGMLPNDALTLSAKNAIRVEKALKLLESFTVESRDATLGEHKDLLEVPMSRQNTAVSASTSSASTASAGSMVSGFRVPAMNEQYVLVSSLKH